MTKSTLSKSSAAKASGAKRSNATSKKDDPNLLSEYGFARSAADSSIRLRNWIFRPSFLGLLAVGAAFCAAWPWLRSQTEVFQSLPEYRIQADQIVLVDRPAWIPDNLALQILDDLGLPQDQSVLDDHLADDLAIAFQRHPWVEEVVSIRKSYPNKIAVELKYRQPVALVRVAQGVYPVDMQGILLPPEDFSSAAVKDYLQVVGVTTIPHGRPGNSWGDACVSGAARIAAVLEGRWKEWQITAIQAPRLTKADTTIEELVFELRGADGSIIVWGRAPGATHPGELTTEQKLGRLEKYVHDYGHFDPAAAQPTWRIDLRDWKAISRTQLSESRPKDGIR